MANHKRKRQPNRRAGCKMCKAQKAVTGFKGKVERELFHDGFGKIRSAAAAKQDMSAALNFRG